VATDLDLTVLGRGTRCRRRGRHSGSQADADPAAPRRGGPWLRPAGAALGRGRAARAGGGRDRHVGDGGAAGRSTAPRWRPGPGPGTTRGATAPRWAAELGEDAFPPRDGPHAEPRREPPHPAVAAPPRPGGSGRRSLPVGAGMDGPRDGRRPGQRAVAREPDRAVRHRGQATMGRRAGHARGDAGPAGPDRRRRRAGGDGCTTGQPPAPARRGPDGRRARPPDRCLRARGPPARARCSTRWAPPRHSCAPIPAPLPAAAVERLADGGGDDRVGGGTGSPVPCSRPCRPGSPWSGSARWSGAADPRRSASSSGAGHSRPTGSATQDPGSQPASTAWTLHKRRRRGPPRRWSGAVGCRGHQRRRGGDAWPPCSAVAGAAHPRVLVTGGWLHKPDGPRGQDPPSFGAFTSRELAEPGALGAAELAGGPRPGVVAPPLGAGPDLTRRPR